MFKPTERGSMSGAAFRAAREALNLTQYEMASNLDLSPATVQRYETAWRIPLYIEVMVKQMTELGSVTTADGQIHPIIRASKSRKMRAYYVDGKKYYTYEPKVDIKPAWTPEIEAQMAADRAKAAEAKPAEKSDIGNPEEFIDNIFKKPLD